MLCCPYLHHCSQTLTPVRCVLQRCHSITRTAVIIIVHLFIGFIIGFCSLICLVKIVCGWVILVALIKFSLYLLLPVLCILFGFLPFLIKSSLWRFFLCLKICYKILKWRWFYLSIDVIMSDCIFCKIIAGEIPSFKIWENDNFVAILDAFPACKGQVLVVPKRHYESDIFLMNNNIYTSLLLATKEVAALMKKGLWVERVGMVVEWLQVSHAHVKLYPFWEGKSFEGGLTGHVMADMAELQKIANQIQKQ